MLYAIDGTGPEAWSDYHADMRRGFCWSLAQRNKGRAEYLRGPTELGLETWQIADLMLDSITRRGRHEIVLAGHSRGGAAVIYLARKLSQRGIRVRAIVLFDAVRRALQRSPGDYALHLLDASTPMMLGYNAARTAIEAGLDFFQVGQQQIDRIPGTVERVLHLVRDEDFSHFFVKTKEYAELTAIARAGSDKLATPDQRVRLERLKRMHERLRDACRFDCIKAGVSTGFSFDNTGLEAEPPCRLEIVKVAATHGALGGAPLDVRSYIKDPAYAAQIEAREVISMLHAQTRVNAFLAEVNEAVASGESLAGAKLDYVPATFADRRSQTAIRR